LPLKLAEEFEKNKGILHRNHRLHSIEKANGKYKLRFFKTETAIGKDGRYTTVDVEPVDDVLAENVILAMPRTALELIEWDQWKENDFLKKYLSSVINQPAIKILLAYDYAWWKSLGMVYGRSITDLPIRQTLYFTSQYDTDLNKISKKPALLLASYNDIETIPFWKALEYAEEDDLFPGPEGYQASKEMVKEANDQIEEMHDYEEMLKPIAAAFFDWSQKPFGAGWHCWKANIKFWEVADQMRHPVDTEKVYICGDAYSYDQGWAEGALETAELVLTKNLDEPLESILEEPLESISEKQYMPKKMKRRR